MPKSVIFTEKEEDFESDYLPSTCCAEEGLSPGVSESNVALAEMEPLTML